MGDTLDEIILIGGAALALYLGSNLFSAATTPPQLKGQDILPVNDTFFNLLWNLNPVNAPARLVLGWLNG